MATRRTLNPDSLGSIPSTSANMARSSNGLGYEIFTLVMGFRLPHGLPKLTLLRRKTLITEIKGTCEFEGCKEPATQIAADTNYNNQRIGCFCDYHADIISERERMEYTVWCPNCYCEFGVG